VQISDTKRTWTNLEIGVDEAVWVLAITNSIKIGFSLLGHSWDVHSSVLSRDPRKATFLYQYRAMSPY